MRRALVVASLALAVCSATAWSAEAIVAKADGKAKAGVADVMKEWREKLSPEEREQLDAHVRYQTRLKEHLRASADPRDWALSAQLSVFFEADDDSADRDVLMRNAASAAPNDVLVQWWAGNWREHAGNSCSRSLPRPEIVAALQAMEPDNGAVWMLSLDAALQAKDDAAVDRVLIQIAASKRFDTHYMDAMNAWSSAYERFGAPPWPQREQTSDTVLAPTVDAQRSLLAMSQAATGMPSYSQLTQACTLTADKAGEQFRRASLCEEAGRHMATVSNTLLDARIGLALVRKAAREQSQDIERNRELAWLEGALARQAVTVDFDAYFDDLRSTRNELEAHRRALQRAELERQAPAWWQPSYGPGPEDDGDE